MSQLALTQGVSDFGGEHDFWETPAYAVEAILPLLPPALQDDGVETRWHLIEPCAGRGAIIDVAFVALAPCALTAFEIDPRRHGELVDRWGHTGALHCHDFLQATRDDCRVGLGPSLWITNPPYSKPREGIGVDILEHALELSGPADCVAFLMQTDVCTGVGTCERIHERYPGSFHPLKRRPSFSGNGKSGTRPFGWFVFDRRTPTRTFRPLQV